MSRRIRRSLIVVFGAVSAAASGLGPARAHASEPSATAAPAATAGDARALFLSRCAPCHGEKGDGRGTVAPLLFPKPRDLTRGTFKFRSTPSGSVPTDEDLLRTVTMGVPGTAMPHFHDLSEGERKGLVEVVKAFSPRFSEKRGTPIEIAAAPERKPERVTSGRAVYERMRCAACHGDGGRGDGPSAPSLKDDDGMPIRPFDFTQGGRMRGGNRPEDIYRTFTTGLDGTPMPSFASSLNEAERWDLVFYVLSLGDAKPPPHAHPDGLKVTIVAKVAEDPNAPEWAAIAPVSVPLLGLWQRRSGADQVAVRVASDGTHVAFHLEWEDPQNDQGSIRPEDFRDGAAVQFPLEEGVRPFFGMGDKARPVNIWHWRADWQLDVERRADVDTQFPAMQVDEYSGGKVSPTNLAGDEAANPMSSLQRASPAEDLNATGLGTITSQARGDQDIQGKGTWGDKKWKVVLRRALTSEGKSDVQFAKRLEVPVAFAVWDGAAGDRNGQKRVTDWVPLKLDLPAAGSAGRCATASGAPLLAAVPLLAALWRRYRRRDHKAAPRP